MANIRRFITDRRALVVIGIFLSVFGIVLFMERGFFASVFMGANIMGNIALNFGDTAKIQTIAAVGGIFFLVGFGITIIGVSRKEKSQ